MTRSADKFRDALRTTLVSYLRNLGFRGSLPTLRRFVGEDTVHVVWLDASTGGEGTYVELGVHFSWLAIDGDRLAKKEWKAIKSNECAFRMRLEDFAGGQLFFYDSEASFLALNEMMRTQGAYFFERFYGASLATTVEVLAEAGAHDFAPKHLFYVAIELRDYVSAERFISQQAAIAASVSREPDATPMRKRFFQRELAGLRASLTKAMANSPPARREPTKGA